MYYLVLTSETKGQIRSPAIAPNNPEHDYSHPSIVNEIRKTGASMVKRLDDIKAWRIE